MMELLVNFPNWSVNPLINDGNLSKSPEPDLVNVIRGTLHDVGNLQTILICQLDLAMRHLTPAQPAFFHLDKARQAARSSITLIRSTTNPSRQASQTVEINQFIRDSVSMIVLPAGLSPLQVSLSDEPLTVSVDPTHLQQAIINLILNAVDAVEVSDGQVVITTGRFHITPNTPATIFLSQHRPPEGDYVTITIDDNGIGMNEQTIRQAFNLFFTTKSEGAGIGLAMVQNVIQACRGAIKVQSQPNQGTTITLFLPHLP